MLRNLLRTEKGVRGLPFVKLNAMSSPRLDISPPVHRLKPGEDLDPSLFTRSIPVLAARIHASETTAMTKNGPIKGQVNTATGTQWVGLQAGP